jgi:hypothetical protein
MRSIAAAAVVLMVVMLAACGSSNPTIATSSTAGVTVTISPTQASVQTGKTQQFTATVTGSTNLTVTWKVNDVVGGNSTIGTVSSSGLYTAPATAPSPGTVSVTAVSAADTTKSASANVTVNAPISVTPSSVTVAATQTQQFTAVVTFNSNTAVTWQVNNVNGGDSTHGTISDTGLYTAPNTIPNPRTVTVTATSKADSSQKASATVTITAPPIVISPTNVTLAAGATQVFTATAGGNNITPTWSVSCQSQIAGGCGSIAKDGTFSAPSAPPPGGTVTINASVSDGSAAPSNTTATIQFANLTLSGSYAFLLTSQDGGGFSPEAGSVAFDGNGKVTAGSIDHNGVADAVSGGSYSVGTDGRGSVTLQIGSNKETWNLVVVNQSQALIARLDANNRSGSGTLDLQTLSSGPSVLNGNYVLALHGAQAGPAAGVTAGAFAIAGSVAADGAGAIASGTVDANENGTVTAGASATGTYVGPNGVGRGTFTLQSALGKQSLVYYMVDTNHFKLLESDTVNVGGGELVRQASGPFTNASFNSHFAFTLVGLKKPSNAVLAIGGVFSMNGNGGITNRTIDGANQVSLDNQGGYTVTDSTTGRTTVTWTLAGSTQQYALYPRFDSGFAMVEIDSGNAAGGLVMRQTLATPSVISLIGSFALDLAGTELGSAGEEIATGVIALTGSTTNIQGTIDLQNASTTVSGGSFQAGAFTVDIATGRGITTAVSGSQVLPGGQFILYLLDAGHALVLETDGTRILSGVLNKQF